MEPNIVQLQRHKSLEGKTLTVDQLKQLIEAGALNGGQGQSLNKLREHNRKVAKFELFNSPRVVRFRQSMKREFGIDIFSEKEFPVQDSRFDFQMLERKLNSRMSEADSEATFVQFLRAGILNVAVNAYQNVRTTYEDWVTAVPSKRIEELYAPMHGIAFPSEVGLEGTYPEVGAAALDIKLRNRKYGAIYAVEWELLEDDQTGSFQRQSALLGEYLKLVSEVICYAKLAGTACTYSNLSVVATETKPSYEANYPYSQAFRGGGKNRPASFTGLTQTAVQNAIIGLVNQKNLQGLKLSIMPNRLVIGPQNAFDAAVLLNSSFWPTGAAAAGVVGGAFAINPLAQNPWKVLLDITVSQFLPDNNGVMDGTSKAWYCMDATKPFFVCQMREPVMVVQENPQSGASFDKDIVRFKGRTRQNADFLDPRFVWQGNDGSV